jgi:WD40 repeat protein
MIPSACPQCGRPLEVVETPAGQQIHCASCSVVILLPAVSVIAAQGVPPASPDEDATVPPQADPNRTVLPAEGTVVRSRPGDAPAGYAILGELGRGGMGVVYQARQIALNRIVALKMILAGGHAGADDLARFRTEAEAIARLQHPHIVQIHEVGEYAGLPFFSLEFCPGGNLEKKLAGTPLPPKEAAALLEKLAQAMHAAHTKGVIHRDLKPANVLLAEDGTPKITDFGLAKKLDAIGQTGSGAIMGTPSYMAPEQASGKSKELGPACDVYALGAVLYECLTGRPPFMAATPLDTIMQVVRDEPVPVTQLNRQVPRDLETICLKCLQKEASKRYATAAALAADLGRWQRGEPIVARPIGAVGRGVKWVRRNPVVAALTATVALVLPLGTGLSIYFAIDAFRQAQAARTAQTRAETELRRAEWLIYAGKLAQAQLQFQDGNRTAALDRLNECQWDLRGWEHRYLWTRFTGKGEELLSLKGHTGLVHSMKFSPDSKRIVSASMSGALKPCELKVWDTATGQELLSLKGHKGSVGALDISPDGKRIAVGTGLFILSKASGEVKVWDGENGQELLSLEQKGPVICLSFSSDSKRIAAVTCRLNETALPAENQGVFKAMAGALPMDPKRFAGALPGKTGDTLCEVNVCDAATGQKLLSGEPSGFVSSLSFSPDGKRIAAASANVVSMDAGGMLLCEVKVWDATTSQELLSLKGHKGPVTSVRFSADGERIISVDRDTMKVWDAKTGEELVSSNTGVKSIEKGGFSPDGQRIVTPGEDHTVKVWDAETGVELLYLKGDKGDANSVSISPDGRRIACASGNTVKVWYAGKGQELLSLKEQGWGTSVGFSPDGQRIACAIDGQVTVWDARKGRELPSLYRHRGRVRFVSFSADGKRLATASPDEVKVWDTETDEEVLSLKVPEGHPDAVTSVSFSPDGKRIATASGSRYGIVRMWDATKGKELLSLKGNRGTVISMSFSPDGKRIACASKLSESNLSASSVKVWDAENAQELLLLTEFSDSVSCVSFSPDGKRLVTASGSLQNSGLPGFPVQQGFPGVREKRRNLGEMKVWDAESGQKLLSFHPNNGDVWCVSFSPDGRRIASGSQDGTVKVWDAATGQELLSLKDHTDAVYSLSFSPDGHRIAFASGNPSDSQKPGGVKVWDLRSGQ